MSAKLYRIIEEYRAMYIHVVAFEVEELGRSREQPGQKWGFLVGIRTTPEPDDDFGLRTNPGSQRLLHACGGRAGGIGPWSDGYRCVLGT